MSYGKIHTLGHKLNKLKQPMIPRIPAPRKLKTMTTISKLLNQSKTNNY